MTELLLSATEVPSIGAEWTQLLLNLGITALCAVGLFVLRAARAYIVSKVQAIKNDSMFGLGEMLKRTIEQAVLSTEQTLGKRLREFAVQNGGSLEPDDVKQLMDRTIANVRVSIGEDYWTMLVNVMGGEAQLHARITTLVESALYVLKKDEVIKTPSKKTTGRRTAAKPRKPKNPKTEPASSSKENDSGNGSETEEK